MTITISFMAGYLTGYQKHYLKSLEEKDDSHEMQRLKEVEERYYRNLVEGKVFPVHFAMAELIKQVKGTEEKKDCKCP